ncbi:hypothetical protein GLAREA_03630 [Glarea lozoyensis ATCC 20868]|uniref:Transcription initiation factor TFIID subunit 8 n=1 Tax=Glarea lozoyensis (strain ATCC 20868 / MF5171) TaxID=1116229 RepID=S3DWA0_GLAL2|nr:uncharacterized protein GLAREA_03630 [Glarea lozoyensis ATCC 20868]EPE30663.1 hypothetical protein GLAREA_03630 [Glarea lozoyensis ATCC 20868]
MSDESSKRLTDMSPISPISRKRSTPSQSDDEPAEEHVSKKIKLEPTLPRTPPPETAQKPLPTRAPHYDDHPKLLLSRSIAIALKHVGFDGAEPLALEAMVAEAEEYMLHFLSKVRTTMLNSRRSHPTPSDFQYGLSRFDCPLLSLKPHLQPPVPRSETLIEMEPMPKEEDQTYSTIRLLGNELSGETDRRLMPHIPAGLPAFPSKHTYKWTEKEPSRETDPRKIREEAAKSAKSAEEALRKFVNVSKAGKEKDVKKNASKDPRSKQRHDLWESTMQKFMAGKTRHGESGHADTAEDDRSMVVNSERRYMRKGATAKRRTQPVVDHAQM